MCIRDSITSGQIDASQFVTHVIPLRDIKKGIDLVKTGEAIKDVYKRQILNTTISSVGIYNSTIKNYSLNIGGKTYSSTSSKFSSSALPSSGEVAITSTVKDSRGYSNTSDASKITV